MKGIILLNGEPYNRDIVKEKDDIVVCCDGAYAWANSKIKIDKIIGDFDSLSFIPQGSDVYPSEKNYTDFELAFLFIKDKVDSLEIYGGGGKRDDHFLGNISILYMAYISNINARMITNYTEIFFAENTIKEKCFINQTISIVPFSDKLHINNSKGLKYPLCNLKLQKFSSRGISNLTLENEFYLEIAAGTALIFKCF